MAPLMSCHFPSITRGPVCISEQVLFRLALPSALPPSLRAAHLMTATQTWPSASTAPRLPPSLLWVSPYPHSQSLAHSLIRKTASRVLLKAICINASFGFHNMDIGVLSGYLWSRVFLSLSGHRLPVSLVKKTTSQVQLQVQLQCQMQHRYACVLSVLVLLYLTKWNLLVTFERPKLKNFIIVLCSTEPILPPEVPLCG